MCRRVIRRLATACDGKLALVEMGTTGVMWDETTPLC